MMPNQADRHDGQSLQAGLPGIFPQRRGYHPAENGHGKGRGRPNSGNLSEAVLLDQIHPPGRALT